MKHSKRTALAVLALSLFLVPVAARAHCDTLDGPVVMTARHALETKDVRPVLAWVKPEHEPEIRAAFTTALSARTSAPRSSAASDQRFFETLVRVHRAGEGAPYTGVKPAGEGVGEGVRAADRAVESGDLSRVEKHLVDGLRAGLHERFATLRSRQPPGKDVSAGREWVEAYVEYVHYVERLDGLLGAGSAHAKSAHHHDGPGAKPEGARGHSAHAH
jgi:hypothetical protein